MNIRVKRTIWMPVVIGVTTGLLIITADAVGFRIPSGLGTTVVDSREIFYSICAALSGPLGTLTAQVVGWFLNPAFASSPNVIVNFVGHCGMGLWVAFAYRFIHERLNSQILKVLAWVGTMLVYYTIYFLYSNLSLSPDFLKEFIEVARSFRGELAFTTFLTTLILFFALSKKFRKPLWYELKVTSQVPVSEV